MNRRRTFILLGLVAAFVLAGCDVPKPPPELPTATPGSQNPESPLSRMALTPEAPEVQKVFAPLPGPPGQIYFVRDSGLWAIYPDGTGEVQLSDLPLNNPPQPSPDGKQVAFSTGKDLYVIPSGGGTAQKIASGSISEGQELGWSPDGSTVGYITNYLSTPFARQAWAIPARGGTPRLIVRLDKGAPGVGPVYGSAVRWSPDGNWVLVADVNAPAYMVKWPPDPSLSPVLIPGGEPDWSPDSRSIIYTESINGALILYGVVAQDATPYRTEQQLVGTRLGEYGQGPGPKWSPASNGSDDDVIAYRSNTGSGEPRVSLRTRGGIELAPLPSLTNNPSWSPRGDSLVVETGILKQDELGLRWAPEDLAISHISSTGKQPQTVVPLTKNGRWPVWGK